MFNENEVSKQLALILSGFSNPLLLIVLLRSQWPEAKTGYVAQCILYDVKPRSPAVYLFYFFHLVLAVIN